MCHWNIFLIIVLAVWPQTIYAQISPNTSALAPTDSATTTPFPSFPSSAPDSTSHTSASDSPNSSTSIPSLESTSSDSLTKSTPESTTQSDETSNSSTFSTPNPSTDITLEDTESTLTSDVTATSPSDVSSISPKSTSDVPPTSPTESSTKAASTSPPPSSTTTPIPSTPSTPAPIPVWTLSHEQKSLIWDATSPGTVIIQAEEGYKLAVKVLGCNMDGVNGDYVIIGTGVAGKGIQFSYTLKRQPSYLFNTNVLYAEFYGTEASTFRANFSRVGEALTTTTTEITTSTQFVPTPSVNDSADMTVFISGRRPTEYKDEKILNRFRDDVHMMATEYCYDQNFDLAEDITINNVKITRLMPCRTSWPNYETCAQITFEVPVYQKEDSVSPWQGYQLNSNHLRVMWDRYHKKYINDDINTFDVPDSNSWVNWQITVSYVTTGVFLVCLLVFYYFAKKFSRGTISDDMNPIIPLSDEDNEVSLQPHYIQQLPPLFENTYQDITPGLSSIINADIHDDLIGNEDRDEPKIDLSEEDLGESGA